MNGLRGGGLSEFWVGGCDVESEGVVVVIVVVGFEGSCGPLVPCDVSIPAVNGEDPISLLFSHPPISLSDPL